MQHIILQQIKNMGDVVLSLPLADLIKATHPQALVSLLGLRYTAPVALLSKNIDHFIEWESIQALPETQKIQTFKSWQASTILHLAKHKESARLAKGAKIGMRVGTWQWFYHWFSCNKHLNQGRRYTKQHETALNFALLKPLGIEHYPAFDEIPNLLHLTPPPLLEIFEQALDPKRFNLILHPGSNGHGREWPVEHFQTLIETIPTELFKIFLTGSATEATRFETLIANCPQVSNMMGKMTLEQLIAFISRVQGLVGSGTGPLHLAGALGIKTLGLFPPRQGISAHRWTPIGKHVTTLTYERPKYQACFTCRESIGCHCMQKIEVSRVLKILLGWTDDAL